MTIRSRLGTAIELGSYVVVSASVAAVALRWLDRDADTPDTSPTTDPVIVEEKLRAYRAILSEIVALNREAVALDPERFRHEADAIAFDQDSELREQYLDVNETYESYLYVIDESVREATSDYVDYLATYHDEGSHAGALLYRAGEVYEAMRADLGLESLFDEESAVPPDVETDGNMMPDPDREPPEVDDFTETLGSAEDLEYFHGGSDDSGSPDEDEDATDDEETAGDAAEEDIDGAADDHSSGS